MNSPLVFALTAGVVAAGVVIAMVIALSRRCAATHSDPVPAALPPHTPAPEATPEAPASVGVLKGVRVLLVDDDEATQRLLGDFLLRAGAEPTFADNGAKALAIFSSWTPDRPARFDLILMDMEMPQLNGYDATRELRQMGLTTPIVAITADQKARSRCLSAGCTDFMPKPVKKAEFVSLCVRCASRQTIQAAA